MSFFQQFSYNMFHIHLVEITLKKSKTLIELDGLGIMGLEILGCPLRSRRIT
jgi:hypothetical protein